MIEVPDRIYTQQADIARFEALITQLPDEARVELQLADGSRVGGTVSVRPALQLFRGGDGAEGFNAVVRLDDAVDPARTHYLWIDRIASITQLGTF